MLRFAILKTVGDGKEVTVLEYKEEQFIKRLKNRVTENLIEIKGKRSKYNKETIHEALVISWNELIEEFKELTVNIK